MSLGVTQIIGFGAGGVAIATVAYTANGSAQNATSFTFSGLSLGTAAANRKIVVGVGSQEAVDTTHVNSITVGGISATELVAINDDAGVDNSTELWIATVPTGTTGDIVIVNSGLKDNFSAAVWAVYGASSTAHDTVSSTANPQTGTINVPAGGVLIACAYHRGGANAYAWTGPVEDFDLQGPAAGNQFSGASIAYLSYQTGLTVTAQPSSTPTHPVMVGVSLAAE